MDIKTSQTNLLSDNENSQNECSDDQNRRAYFASVMSFFFFLGGNVVVLFFLLVFGAGIGLAVIVLAVLTVLIVAQEVGLTTLEIHADRNCDLISKL